MVWPYGRYNMQTVQIAKKLGMPITITLDDGADHAKQSLQNMSRILVEADMTTDDLAQEIKNRELNLTDNNRPQKLCILIWTIFMIQTRNSKNLI